MLNRISSGRSAHFMTVALAMLFCLGLAAPATAQTTDHRWEIGFALGSGFDDGDGLDLDIRSDFRGGYFFTDRFELEGQLIRAEAVLDTSLTAWMANAVFNFRSDRAIVPYVLVGAGYAEVQDIDFVFGLPGTELVDFRQEDEESGAFQVAAGSRFFVGAKRRMAFRVELSSLWTDAGNIFGTDRQTNLTGGLSWTLGSR